MDLFAGLDGLGSTSSKKLSLAEQRRIQDNNNKNTVQAFESLDVFSGAPSTPLRPSPPAMSTASSMTSHTNSTASEDDDLFGIFNSAPPPKSQPETKTQSIPGTRSSVERPAEATRARQQEYSAFADEAETLQPRQSEPVRVSTRPPPLVSRPPPKPASQVSDRSLAQLVDMGFEPEDAQRALAAMNGNVRGAVNWLMAEAQGLPLPEPKSGPGLGSADFSDFQASASQFGASMFSKASSLFAKGRKEIEKAYNQYNNQYNGDQSQPAWMRDKPKYDARASRSPDPELPRRPSRQPSREASASLEGSVRSVSLGDQPPQLPAKESVRPGRPSRAELFRQKQKERELSRTRASSPASPSLSNNEIPPSSSPTPQQTVSEATPDVDLLNLSSTSVNKTALSSTETDLYSTSRSLGSEAFRKGDYEGAVVHYTAALQVVPEGHALRALLLSNRSAASLKAGNLRGAFDDTAAGIALLPNKGLGIDIGEKGVSMSDIWVKLVTRNAQAAESMEKFEAALQSWQLLLDNGYASPAVLAAKRRCLKALNPEAVKKASSGPENGSSAKKSQRRGWGTTGAVPTSAAGKAALEKVKASHSQQAEEEKQKDLLRDKVGQRVASWRDGNEKNLRVLLATLQNVLWDSCEWTPVSEADLVVPKKVRLVYMKAVARTHPDKVPNTAPVEVRMISQSVFVVLQHAWDTFRQENSL